MSFQVPNKSYQATGNVLPSVFVTISGSETVAQSASGDRALAGVTNMGTKKFDSTLAAASGDSVGVFGPSQECYLTLGSGGATAGDLLSPDASGYGVTAASGSAKVVGALALDTGSAGNLIKVRVLSPTVA